MAKAHWPPRVQPHAIPWPATKRQRSLAQQRLNQRPFPRHRLRRLCEAQNNRCCYCGTDMVWEHDHKRSPTIEHVIPLSKGGPRNWSNEVAACQRCNGGRKTTDALDYLFQSHAGMASSQWRNWTSRERKTRRAQVLKAIFARLGVPTGDDARPLDSLRDCWPRPTIAKKLAVATRTEVWAKAAADATVAPAVATSICQPGIT